MSQGITWDHWTPTRAFSAITNLRMELFQALVIGGIGGKGGTYEKRLDSVESLELAEEGGGAGRRWRQLAPMSTPRSSHTCEVMGGLIYVVGGGDGKDWLCSAEVSSLHWLGLFKFNI